MDYSYTLHNYDEKTVSDLLVSLVTIEMITFENLTTYVIIIIELNHSDQSLTLKMRKLNNLLSFTLIYIILTCLLSHVVIGVQKL